MTRPSNRPLTPPTPQRSRIMAAIRGTGNESTELAYVRVLRAQSVGGWRRQARLPGKPDVVFPRLGVAVFLDGCFWHGCTRCHKRAPKTNRSFWMDKIAGNRRRDRRVTRTLRKLGWRVVRVWEHDLRKDRLWRLGLAAAH